MLLRVMVAEMVTVGLRHLRPEVELHLRAKVWERMPLDFLGATSALTHRLAHVLCGNQMGLGTAALATYLTTTFLCHVLLLLR